MQSISFEQRFVSATNEHNVTEVLKITQTTFQIHQNWITPSKMFTPQKAYINNIIRFELQPYRIKLGSWLIKK